ncbi:MAG TPA: sugar transferase [Roseiflexaceae bacterium]|nr:sugar transferase [Roseiflexaceae bacterium]
MFASTCTGQWKAISSPDIACRSLVFDATRNSTMYKFNMAAHVGQTESRGHLVGLLLRRTYLDALPQLINVLEGDLSIVDPHPPKPEVVNLRLPISAAI